MTDRLLAPSPSGSPRPSSRRPRRALLVRAGALLAGGAALVAASTVAPATAIGRGGGAQGATALSTTAYAPSSAPLANPDRGFYHYTETHLRRDGSGAVPLDAAQLTRWRTTQGVTLVYRVFYLERLVDEDRIDPAYLASVAADLATARAAGVRLVLRFAYSADSERDAPADRVVLHIRQLAPVLNANADVISALQAGFVGRWGEWYYSTNFASDQSRPWVLTAADWSARSKVLMTLLDSTAATIPVQVRYPAIKQRLLGGAGGEADPRAARVGIHDDCFLAGTDDYGTFASPADRTWLAEQTRSVVLGGETCTVNGSRSTWPSASQELAAYHWTYLNADYHQSVLQSWGAEGLAEAGRRLGYRLLLTQSSAPIQVPAGGQMTLMLTLRNDGYAAAHRSRPAYLLLRGPSATVRVRLPLDVRRVTPGTTMTFPVTVAAPTTPGTYRLALSLPDPSPRLATNPAYALQLANVSTWQADAGTNDLRRSVVVTAGAL